MSGNSVARWRCPPPGAVCQSALQLTVVILGFVLAFLALAKVYGIVPPATVGEPAQHLTRFVDTTLRGMTLHLPRVDVLGRAIPKGELYFASLSCSSCQPMPPSLASVTGREPFPVVFVATDRSEAITYAQMNRRAFLVAAPELIDLPTSMLNFAPQAVQINSDGVVVSVLGPDSGQGFAQ